jgi:hypothetical protein
MFNACKPLPATWRKTLRPGKLERLYVTSLCMGAIKIYRVAVR